LPPVSDKEEVGSLISNTWGPVFRRIKPEYNIDDFLNCIEHLLPDYSDFSLNTSDKAILDSVMTTIPFIVLLGKYYQTSYNPISPATSTLVSLPSFTSAGSLTMLPTSKR